MGTNWEELLGVDGEDLDEAWDQAASDALYQDHPWAPGPFAPEPAEVLLPFEEE